DARHPPRPHARGRNRRRSRSLTLSDPIRLLVSGAGGRMGQTVGRLAADDPAFELVGGLDREATPAQTIPTVRTLADAEDLILAADVVVDFSAPLFLRSLLERHADSLAGRALV